MKVKITNKSGCSYIVNMDKNTQIYPHFRLFELANNKGNNSIPQMILTPETDDFMCIIEAFRDWWNKPMNCNSCYRQELYNKAVGGASNSLHLLALAFDWHQQLTYKQRVSVAQQWQFLTKRAGKIGGINFYDWGVHLDANEDKFGYKNFIIRDKHSVIVQSVPNY